MHQKVDCYVYPMPNSIKINKTVSFQPSDFLREAAFADGLDCSGALGAMSFTAISFVAGYVAGQ